MLTPCDVKLRHYFEALEYRPAVHLASTVPPGVDADILHLGCGDAMSILYSAYAETGLPPRKLDITCCDYDANVLARNIVLLSFVRRKLKRGSYDKIWNIFYDHYLDRNALKLLDDQLAMLNKAVASWDEWHASSYGSAIKFCDQGTFDSFRTTVGNLAMYATVVAAGDDLQASYEEFYKKVLECSRDDRDSFLSRSKFPNLSRTAARSVLPLPLDQSIGHSIDQSTDQSVPNPPPSKDLSLVLGKYWELGSMGWDQVQNKDDPQPPQNKDDPQPPQNRDDPQPLQNKDDPQPPQPEPDRVPNPLFALPLRQSGVTLDPRTDPVLRYHLAMAYVKLRDRSPLNPKKRPDSDKNYAKSRAALSSRAQWRAWIDAAKSMFGDKRLVIRPACVDALVLGHTLSYLNGDPTRTKLTANWLAMPFIFGGFELHASQYGPVGSAPSRFDAIDATGLTTSLGMLNILLAVGPLLKSLPWSCLVTDFSPERYDRGKFSTKFIFDMVLSRGTITLGAALGFTVSEYWTNATTLGYQADPALRVPIRVSWVPLSQFSGLMTGPHPRAYSQNVQEAPGCLKMSVAAVVGVLWNAYWTMFRKETHGSTADIKPWDLLDGLHGKPVGCYHRGTFAALVHALKTRVDTDWPAVRRKIVAKVQSEETDKFRIGKRCIREFETQLRLYEVFDFPRLDHGLKTEKKPPAPTKAAGKAARKAAAVAKDAINRLPFRYWKDIPEIIAVTVVGDAKPLLGRLCAIPQRRSAVSVEAVFERDHGGTGISPIYQDVHLMWGTAEPVGNPDSDDFALREAAARYDPYAPRFTASFYCPTAAVAGNSPEQVKIALQVGLNLHTSVWFDQQIQEAPNDALTFFRSVLSDRSSVYITRYLPSQTAYPKLAFSVPPVEPVLAVPEEPADTKPTSGENTGNTEPVAIELASTEPVDAASADSEPTDTDPVEPESTAAAVEGILNKLGAMLPHNSGDDDGPSGAGITPSLDADNNGTADGEVVAEEVEVVHDGVTTMTLEIESRYQRADGYTGRVLIRDEIGQRMLSDKCHVEPVQISPFTYHIILTDRTKKDKKVVYPLDFPLPVYGKFRAFRVARTSHYVEVDAPLAIPPMSSPQLLGSPMSLGLTRAPAPTRGIDTPVALPGTPYISLDALPILDINDSGVKEWLEVYPWAALSSREKAMQRARTAESDDDEGNKKHHYHPGGSPPKPLPLTPADTLRLRFKVSITTLFQTVAKGKTGLIALCKPGGNGNGSEDIQMLICVSAMRLDGAGATVVADAAVIPLTQRMLDDDVDLRTWLVLTGLLDICYIDAEDDELEVWRRALPAMAERCRTWEHLPTCEYKSPDSNGVKDKQVKQDKQDKQYGLSWGLCSCGAGKIPPNFLALPEWDAWAAPHAVRVAVSPVFPHCIVEEEAPLPLPVLSMGHALDFTVGVPTTADLREIAEAGLTMDTTMLDEVVANDPEMKEFMAAMQEKVRASLTEDAPVAMMATSLGRSLDDSDGSDDKGEDNDKGKDNGKDNGKGKDSGKQLITNIPSLQGSITHINKKTTGSPAAAADAQPKLFATFHPYSKAGGGGANDPSMLGDVLLGGGRDVLSRNVAESILLHTQAKAKAMFEIEHNAEAAKDGKPPLSLEAVDGATNGEGGPLSRAAVHEALLRVQAKSKVLTKSAPVRADPNFQKARESALQRVGASERVMLQSAIIRADAKAKAAKAEAEATGLKAEKEEKKVSPAADPASAPATTNGNANGSGSTTTVQEQQRPIFGPARPTDSVSNAAADQPVVWADRCRLCGVPKEIKPLMRCVRCLSVWYCSAECQRTDWKKHKARECRKPGEELDKIQNQNQTQKKEEDQKKKGEGEGDEGKGKKEEKKGAKA